ncbi:cobalt transporter CbiM [Thermohalobacter berrensis]|uniref:Cobalamin biosynthesis protein CbiM n=1 Tax=Thermohalobacter berrensis TaxID=99594 RepID=A0A419SUD1_9FIRM|nr:cobalt transporter CbiM [Thermohalobacter berrensis]RKD28788.1 cobalamin biosynthesis protein CbiM [Thermohalobacter berrensis]
MHIPDGILPVAVCASGYGLTGLATWYSLKKIKEKEDPRKEIPKASLGTAAFFVASWISIPIPPASVHLVLTGLLGILLGYYAFPAVLISLFFQAVMFQHGGLTTLGVNAIILGLPAILAHYTYTIGKKFLYKNNLKYGILGFIIGSLSIGISVILFYTIVITFIPANIDVNAEKIASLAFVISHIPLMIIEGIFTAFVLIYLKKVKPEMLEAK